MSRKGGFKKGPSKGVTDTAVDSLESTDPEKILKETEIASEINQTEVSVTSTTPSTTRVDREVKLQERSNKFCQRKVKPKGVTN